MDNVKKEQKYGVLAEKIGHHKSLLMINLSFGRLVDEILIPYDNEKSFFIDGTPVEASKLEKIKIFEIGENFNYHLNKDLTMGLQRGDAAKMKILGDQYETRLQHIILTKTIDVTSQVISAFNKEVKPKLTDYLPKREEIISAAFKIFIESMKQLT